MTTTITVTGSGFYPSNTATLTITTSGGSVTTYSTSTTSAGAITDSITISSITGISTATYINMFATDVHTGDVSNTIQIQVLPAINPWIAINSNWQVTGTGFTPNGVAQAYLQGVAPGNKADLFLPNGTEVGTVPISSTGTILCYESQPPAPNISLTLVDVSSGKASNSVIIPL